MPAHVPLASWRNESDARNDRPSEAVLSLDGSTEASWQFKLFNSVQAVPDSWPARGIDMESIEVPGHWQLQGYDHPIYTNVKYPFPDGRQWCRMTIQLGVMREHLHHR